MMRIHVGPFVPAVLLVVVLQSACFVEAVPSSSDAKPVVLVPGLAGSVFEARLDKNQSAHFWCRKHSDSYVLEWISIEHIVPGEIDCLMEDLSLHYDPESGTYMDFPGVDLNTEVDFGGLGGIAYLDPSLKVSATSYYEVLAQKLVDTGEYVVSKNLRGAPFDWRLAPDGLKQRGYFDRLRGLIEESYADNENQRVIVVGHSMGCDVLLYFLSQQSSSWKAKYIEAFIPISPPWKGATSSVLGMISGNNFQISVIPHAYFHPVQSTCASGPWLAVDQQYVYDNVGALVETPSKNYNGTFDGYIELFSDLGLQQAKALYPVVSQLSLSQLPFPGVDVHVFYGYNVDTPDRLVYSSSFQPGVVPDAPHIVYADGDGTVNIKSLLAAKSLWEGPSKVSGKSLSYSGFKNASHMGILSDEQAVEALVTLISGY